MSHPVDIFVGARLKCFRKQKGLTQAQLAGKLRLTFQQIQKYEKGTNRVSASRLYDASRILGVGVHHFFEGYDNGDGNVPNLGDTVDLMSEVDIQESAQLLSLLRNIPNASTRKALIELLKVMRTS